MSQTPTCKICGGQTEQLFQASILQKYPVAYHQCISCDFIQTDEVFWLEEAYTNAMTALDVGLLDRNLRIGNQLPAILDRIAGDNGAFLDYGGGYGLLVRLMRDKGYDFYLDDRYAENHFARYFEKQDGPAHFDAITSFEVFEHLLDPVTTVKDLFKSSDTIIFSTELAPQGKHRDADSWWYFAPQTGQHIAFYSRKTLTKLAELFNCYVHTNEVNLHMLTRKEIPFNAITGPIEGRKAKLKRMFVKPAQAHERASFLNKDFELYKSKLLASAQS